jgi:hypothetical protein
VLMDMNGHAGFQRTTISTFEFICPVREHFLSKRTLLLLAVPASPQAVGPHDAPPPH